MRCRRRAVGLSLLVALLLGAGSASPAGAALPDLGDPDGRPDKDRNFEPTFAPSSCPVPVPAERDNAVTCGYVTVPLEWEDPERGTIELAVARFTAVQPSGDPPLLVLAGGPGEKLVEPYLASYAEAPTPPTTLFERRDLIIVDQRGVGASRPSLDCPEVEVVLSSVLEAEALPPAAVAAYAACRARLVGEGIDLSAFDTANNVDDIDAVRRALGEDRVHLFGTSYGARLGLQVAREHGDGLASLVLSSPVPAERNFIAETGLSYDRVLGAIDAACAADPECDASNPDLLETLETALAALQASPATVEVPDPATGQPVTVTVEAFDVAQLLFIAFYQPDGPSLVPALITALGQGAYELFAVPPPAEPIDSPTTLGVQASFLCAEEAEERPPSWAPEPSTLAARLLVAYNPILGPNLEEVCEVWDVEPGSPETFEPATTSVRTLIVTGQFDQITPPFYGEEVAAALPDDVYLEIPGAGHSPLLGAGACGAALLEDFLSDPGGELDTGCVPAAPTFLTLEELLALLQPQEPMTAAAGLALR